MIRSCGHRDKQNINVETRNFSAQDAEKMRHPTSVPLSPCASSSSRRLQISVPRTALSMGRGSVSGNPTTQPSGPPWRIKFWACPRRPWPRPLYRLLTVNRCGCIGHCVHVSHVGRRIAKREAASRAGDGLRANKVETERWRWP